MNKLKLFFLIAIALTSQFSYGIGGEPNYNLRIDAFEQTQNFYYASIQDSLFYYTDKGKEKFKLTTVNIAFYDIDEDSTFNLFSKDFNQRIVSFNYEVSYNDTLKSIEFLSDQYYDRDEFIKNNRNIEERDISPLITIITYSMKSRMYTLWTCTKTGQNLKEIVTYRNSSDLKLDVYNNIFLVINHIKEEKAIKVDKYPIIFKP